MIRLFASSGLTSMVMLMQPFCSGRFWCKMCNFLSSAVGGRQVGVIHSPPLCRKFILEKQLWCTLTGNINTPLADISECLVVDSEFCACFDKSRNWSSEIRFVYCRHGFALQATFLKLLCWLLHGTYFGWQRHSLISTLEIHLCQRLRSRQSGPILHACYKKRVARAKSKQFSILVPARPHAPCLTAMASFNVHHCIYQRFKFEANSSQD